MVDIYMLGSRKVVEFVRDNGCLPVNPWGSVNDMHDAFQDVDALAKRAVNGEVVTLGGLVLDFKADPWLNPYFPGSPHSQRFLATKAIHTFSPLTKSEVSAEADAFVWLSLRDESGDEHRVREKVAVDSSWKEYKSGGASVVVMMSQIHVSTSWGVWGGAEPLPALERSVSDSELTAGHEQQIFALKALRLFRYHWSRFDEDMATMRALSKR